tara:strand:- start:420 stop:545 length:126 start_codon:yes stop_codon:yes gene_type:complete
MEMKTDYVFYKRLKPMVIQSPLDEFDILFALFDSATVGNVQ